MRIKLSHKDLLLLIGIVVAVVITFTTWFYNDMPSKTSAVKPTKANTSLNTTPSVAFNKFAEESLAKIFRVL